LSLFGMTKLGSSMSLLDVAFIGSSLSLRAFSRLGSGLSVLGFSHLGASLSLRSMSRIGSSFSLLGLQRLGSSMSVFDVAHLGSSLSLRSFSRLGAALSVFDFVHLGSTLSVRGIARFGDKVQTCAKLIFTNANNYIYETDSDAKVGFYVNNARSMVISAAGGVLHGTWSADSSISTSDRRLKENIKPLHQTLKQIAGSKKSASIQPGTGGPAAGGPSVGSWLLRQLRPVSYNFKKGNEAKYMRFGFIADEIEQVLPQVVRELPVQDEQPEGETGEKPEPKKGIVYTDLIAVLTTIVKDFNVQLKGLQGRMKTAEIELDTLDQEDPVDRSGMP